MNYYYNRNNIFNLQPNGKGIQGIPGSIGPTGPKGDTGERGDNFNFGHTIDFRLYQDLSENRGPSWDDLNGYYALDKNTYPVNDNILNYIGDTYWTNRLGGNQQFSSIIWCNKLGLYLVFRNNATSTLYWYSNNGIFWNTSSMSGSVRVRASTYSPELNMIVVLSELNSSSQGGIVNTSNNGITWNDAINTGYNKIWRSVCWSKELNLFCAAGSGEADTSAFMISNDGFTWELIEPINYNRWYGVCWSSELGMFVSTSVNSSIKPSAPIIYSYDGRIWHESIIPEIYYGINLRNVVWCKNLGLFCCNSSNVAVISYNGINWEVYNNQTESMLDTIYIPEYNSIIGVGNNDGSTITISNNGKDWTPIRVLNSKAQFLKSAYSPELGMLCAVSFGDARGIFTATLKGRIPTSYNIFDYSSFNSIDESGNWTIQQLNNGVTSNNSNVEPNVAGLNLYSLGNTIGTTITNFTNGVTFQPVTLYFTNNLTTISSNNSIRLQSGITFSGTTFDTLRLLYTGNEWVELSRSVN
jgi:hypothetical protein